MKRTALIGFFLLAFWPALRAQDSNFVRQQINQLTSRAMYGRGYAYHGDSIAAAYLIEQLAQNNLQPLEANYLQPYSFPVHAMEGPVSVKVNGTALRGWEDYVIAPFSPSARGTFLLYPMDYRILLDQQRQELFFQQNKKAKDGLIYIDITQCTDEDTLRILNRLFNMLNRFKKAFPCRGFVVGVDEMSPWTVGLGYQPSEYLLLYMKRHIVSDKRNKLYLSYNNEIRMHHTQNICAMIPGHSIPDSMVVLTAHYDHIGMMGDDVMFPGCHDNASGTAAALDIARHFQAHPLPYTFVLLIFSAEEAGLLGSTYFVSHPLIDLGKIKMVVNLDLLCGGDDGIMVVNAKSFQTQPFYDSLMQENERRQWVKEVKARDNAANSDHFPFTEKGVPAIFIYTLGGRYGGYHNPYDTAERASLSAYPGIANLIINTLEETFGNPR